MITQIKVNNLKAFEKFKIQLKPITLFLGPNNSGKSSILSSLRILAQTIESYDSNVPLLLNGLLGDFGSYKDIIHKNSKNRKLTLSCTIDSKSNYIGFKSGEIEIDMDFIYRTKRREIILNTSKFYLEKNLILSTNYSIDTEKQSIISIGGKDVPSALKAKFSDLFRYQNFLPQRFLAGMYSTKSLTGDFIDEKVENAFRNISKASNEIHKALKNIEYVGAMRVPPTRTFIYTGESRAKIGANGQFAANLLALDAAKGGKKSKNIIQNVKQWMLKAEMASDIKIEPISERHYELKIQHPVTKEYQNYSDVGFGHSQVLPVLIGGFNLPMESTFIVEQPEIHLHPKAQAELGDFFLNLYSRQIQSLIETHSEHLILRLQRYVIEGKISPDDIVFYFVHASNEKKQIVELHLDENGKFTTEWPQGFFPERLDEAREMAKSRFEKQKGK